MVVYKCHTKETDEERRTIMETLDMMRQRDGHIVGTDGERRTQWEQTERDGHTMRTDGVRDGHTTGTDEERRTHNENR